MTTQQVASGTARRNVSDATSAIVAEALHGLRRHRAKPRPAARPAPQPAPAPDASQQRDATPLPVGADAPPLSVTPTEADVTVAALGRRLVVMRGREHLLDKLTGVLGTEAPHAPMDARRLAQRHAKAAYEATSRHCYALEEVILASRAETAEDAIAQVFVSLAFIDRIAGGETRAARQEEQDKVEAALYGAVRALAGSRGQTMQDVTGGFYSSTWCDPWPEVDLSGIQAEADLPQGAAS